MNRPTATAAPSRLTRRLVLGTAFALALAVTLAPRTPAVSAQEAKPAPGAVQTSPERQPGPAAAPRPPASKTVTITDGRGVEAKIEITEAAKQSATAGTKAADPGGAEDSNAAGAGKSASGSQNVTVGKRARVRIDGLGTDREFDSFEEFVHSEPEIAGMVVAIVTVVFMAPVLAIGLILWYRIRKTRMLNETMLALAERGVVTPADALSALANDKQAAVLAATAATTSLSEQAKQIRRRAAWSDLRKGVLVGGVGLALTLYSILEDREPNGLGLVLLFVGIGFVVLWWFEERQLAPGNSASPAAGGSSARGGPPPSA